MRRTGCDSRVGCDRRMRRHEAQEPAEEYRFENRRPRHPHEGPHGGHVIDLGSGEYHAELTHDDTTKSVAIYLFDAELKKPVTTTEQEITINLTVDGKPQEYKLPAAPQAEDAKGESSRFELKDDKLVDAWDAPKSTGRVRVNIGGKSYSGDIEAHEHGEHKHETKK